MRRRPVVILLFALACGGLSAYLAREYLVSRLAATPAPPRAAARVAVAARDLAAGSVLGPGDVKLIEWPEEMPPPGYLDAPSALVGEELVYPVNANEPILESKLANASVGGLAAAIPPGMRAVSVKVDEVIAVGGFVVPRSRVDVLVTMPATSNRPGATRIALQNIKVVAVGQSFEANEQAKPQEATVITLLVTPEQAEVLTLASSEGQIQLALRNPLDESRSVSRGDPANALVGRAPSAPRAPTRAPPVARQRSQEVPVEIYHGSARSVSSF